jgi:hypothetical protein
MKNEYETEEKHEIASISLKVDQLRRVTRTLIIMLAVIIFLNGVILYYQFFRVGNLSEAVNQQTTRVDDLLITVGNLTDNSIGTTTEIGNVKQDIGTIINLLRDAKITANQPTTTNMELKSPLHVQFSCLDDSSSQPVDPCAINVKVLEINPVDEFVIDAGQMLKIVPARIRLSISVNVSGYATYSNIFEYTENGEVYPVEIKLIKQ